MAQWRTDSYEYKQPHNVHLYELNMVADEKGNPINGSNPTGMAVDAFGRARSSQPFTLFDSFHRYQDNGKISSANSATGATMSHNANGGFIQCTLDTTANSFIYRESSRVFSYQPGKSLQVLQTFQMATPKTNLRQRYGYFGTKNGFFLEVANTDVYLVRRDFINGSVRETRVPQSQWNYDRLDGSDTSVSHLTLDLSKPQIMFTDIEWLGVGSVRQGFVIDGVFRLAHTWHHANQVDYAPYMTTACLPIRAEIENTGATASNSTLKIVCSTVISEGGYEAKGRLRVAARPLTSPKDLPSAGTFYPVISIRLKDSRMDGIAFVRALEFFGITNNTNYRWKVTVGGTLTNPVWVSAGDDSSVEYDISATDISGGVDLRSEYTSVSSGQKASLSEIGAGDIFRYQLERNSFVASNNGIIYSITATGAAAGDDCLGAIQWEEIT